MSERRVIKGFDGLYEVDRSGNVFSVVNNHKMAQTVSSRGYCMVHLHDKTHKSFTKSVHRIVAEAFIPNKNNLPCVNHKNGIKTDNNIKNLEWCTFSENSKHSVYSLGHIPKNTMDAQAKSVLSTSLPVMCVETGNKYTSCSMAAKVNGLPVRAGSNISKCASSDPKFITCHGYHWKYLTKGIYE